MLNLLKYKRNNLAFRMVLIFGTVLLSFSACYSVPQEIDNNLSAMELIQKAQEASDRNRYKVSLAYYEAVLERYSWDNEYLCAAEYEIAFIRYKQKNYDAAKAGFISLLQRYDGADSELLPQQYKILSNIVLEKIEIIESRKEKT